MNKMKKVLAAKGLIYDETDFSQYNSVQALHSIHSWGFIIAFDCDVLPTMYNFYDKTCTLIYTIDSDDIAYTIDDGFLNCEEKYLFKKTNYSFSYDLNQGAPIHKEDVVALLKRYDDRILYFDAVLFTKNNIYCFEEGKGFKDLSDTDVDVIDFLNEGYEMIPEEGYPNNIEMFNNLIVTHTNRKEVM
jgi:hypothetical protein